MPSMNILADLKSAMQSINRINYSLSFFEQEMQELRVFFKHIKHLEDATFINHSNKVFEQWSIKELLLFLAFFANDEELHKMFDNQVFHPQDLLEDLFLRPLY